MIVVKNKHAKRTVKVSNECIELLINFTNNRPLNIAGYLFTHNGPRISNATVNKSIKEACTALDIKRRITSHAFRHTQVSYLISKRLGHSNISMTLNKYGHLLEEIRKQDEQKTIKLLNAP
ncbi:tyrosine-type recombinase/integrase [Staphylococcus pseudintermedius]|uniref:tyrosine-type recombinase/integrase n=1 Tax=Staphylococcus pseudintermedius TaxID=283734 RepID=UPI002ED82B5A